jgi:hypothetical protein
MEVLEKVNEHDEISDMINTCNNMINIGNNTMNLNFFDDHHMNFNNMMNTNNKL